MQIYLEFSFLMSPVVEDKFLSLNNLTIIIRELQFCSENQVWWWIWNCCTNSNLYINVYIFILAKYFILKTQLSKVEITVEAWGCGSGMFTKSWGTSRMPQLQVKCAVFCDLWRAHSCLSGNSLCYELDFEILEPRTWMWSVFGNMVFADEIKL